MHPASQPQCHQQAPFPTDIHCHLPLQQIAHGRRYGLLGPNGMGKTTLLKHLAARKLPVSKSISMLYVEQEVVGTDTPAFEEVMRADKERWVLLDREKALLEEINEADAALKVESDSDKAEALADKLVRCVWLRG